MAVSEGFAEFLRDVLSGVGPVTIRKMFGGAGVYLGGVMFGLVVDDTFYLRGDETSAADFEAEGKGPFVYRPKDRAPVTMPYWELPERLYDDPDQLAPWARRALDIANRARPAARRKSPRRGA
jgi:DNA transformation protein